MTLTHDQQRRYARHLLLPEIGEAGQQQLAEASVLVIGAGGLGAASLSYLAAAGVGTIGIVDDDVVERSNLNRQIIHETGDIGRRKTDSAADRLSEINPDVTVRTYQTRLEEHNAAELIHDYPYIIDGSDTFTTRLIVNRACHQHGKVLISAAVRGWDAQISTFKSSLGEPHPCYQCLVPEAPDNRQDCAERGVIGPLTGVIGSMQAIEAIREILGLTPSLSGRLLRYNALTASWQESTLVRDPACPICST